jgi:hypothetical protein
MPKLEFTGLIAAYVVIAVLLLSLNLYSRWSWWARIITNIIVAGFFWVTYVSYQEMLGWPTKHSLPNRFYLHAANIDEPNVVYLWGTDLDRGFGRGTPRAYELPYDKSLHDRVDKATRKLRKGLPVIGEVSVSGLNQESSDTVEVKVNQTEVQFIDAPDALVPGKTNP